MPGLLAEMASNKSDRSMSPSTLSEEGRRDLIARQHRALYGESSGMISPGYAGDDSPRDQTGNAKAPIGGGPRGPSPRVMDPFGGSADGGQDGGRADKTTSPSGQAAPGFTTFDGKAATPPTGEDGPHARSLSKSTTAPVSGGMAPIGSRPHPQNQAMNKRTTSPLPAALSYGFGANDQNERSTSSNSNPNAQKEGSSTANIGAAWGTGSGVWGSNKIGATSVWG
jgi:hypothetical protein